MGCRVCLLLSLLSLLALTSCTPSGRSAGPGVVVLDEDVQLVRGEHMDTAQREFAVDADATFAAFVQEDGCDVVVKLEAEQTGRPTASVAVDNAMVAMGLEVAALDAGRGSRFTLRIESPQDNDEPCHLRTRLLRFDANSGSEARIAALHAWTAATPPGIAAREIQTTSVPKLQIAREFLSSAHGKGDAELAAWTLLVRAWLCNFRDVELKRAIADASRAAIEFSALGQPRNVARSRMVRYAALSDIAMDKSATAPSAAEATRELETGLLELGGDPALSDRERARVRNMLAIHFFNQGNFDEAGRWFSRALSIFESVRDRRGANNMRTNLGVLAAEMGDFQSATRYFDVVISNLNVVGSAETRVLYLLNAGRADTSAGYIDRAIDRLQLARQMSSAAGLTTYDAYLMQALGRAYWVRGDISQAANFYNEELRLRRQPGSLQDPLGLQSSLHASGILEREAGHVDSAISLHREAVKLAWSTEMRLRGLVDLAYDYAAIPDYRRAIATCREALALPLPTPGFYKWYETQLALGDFLLEQPGAGAAAAEEAQSLVAAPLDVAVRRADAAMEIAARHVQASSLALRGRRDQARAEYVRAIDLIFRYSSTSTNPELQAYSLAREQATFRGYLDLLMSGAAVRTAGALRPASPDEAEALRTIEWVRASSLSSTHAATLDAKSAAQVDALLAQMAGKRVRIAALLERPDDTAREVERLQLDIANLRTEIDRQRARGLPAVVNPAGVPSLPTLAANVVQWSFASGNRQTYFWVRDASGIRASVLPRDALPGDATALQVVADGPLSSLPFAALPGIGERAVVMISSEFGAGSSMPAHPRALRFLGVAGGAQAPRDGSGVFPPLASTTREARSVAAIFERARPEAGVKLLLGDEGSSAALSRFWEQGVDVLHVATHALADLHQPMTSLLLLPAVDSQGQATYLTAGQIQQWRGDADLVYLSACETGVGPTRFADGMPGLQRAFLRAGAHGVIATLWPVDDVYAAQFAADFYRRYTAGESAAAALTDTQRAWAQPLPGISASEQQHRRLTAWAHAFYTK